MFDDFLICVLEISKYFRVLIPEKFKKLNKKSLFDYWKSNFAGKKPEKICYDMLLGKNKLKRDYLIRSDFIKVIDGELKRINRVLE